jgi:hypothetical protein
MAYPRTRSMNADLGEGLTDGKYKKVNPNRGGQVEGTTYRARKDLHDRYFGIHEAEDKVFQDGLEHGTPGYVPTPEADLL